MWHIPLTWRGELPGKLAHFAAGYIPRRARVDAAHAVAGADQKPSGCGFPRRKPALSRPHARRGTVASGILNRKRREFLLGGITMGALGTSGPSPAVGTLTDVAGLRVGHWHDLEALTGCTVVLCEGDGAVGGVDVRGGGPGTRETDLLAPGRSVERVHGIVLTGGSAFGLAAATGVMEWLEEQGIGYDTAVVKVPIVPAAVIFDLGIGSSRVRPGAAEGYAAAAGATNGPVAQGNVGAGAGATAGKWAGMQYAMKTGLGSSSVRLPGGGTVGALVVSNPLGDIVDPLTGRIVAGAYDREQGAFLARPVRFTPGSAGSFPPANTVIAVVATDLALSREAVHRVAQMAHDGLARAVYPAHTPWDGDTAFALATGRVGEPAPTRAAELERVALVGAAAAEALALAIVRSAQEAEPAGGLPAARALATE